MKYYHITKEDVAELAKGEEVVISIGKRVKRVLTTKSEVEMKREKLDAEYKAKLSKLEVV